MNNRRLPGAPTEIEGPRAWRNWRAMEAGKPCIGMVELKLFTDAWIIAETQHGPYRFLNTVPETRPGGQYDLTPSVALRVEYYIDHGHLDMSATRDDHYHGGTLHDEVAALISLILGTRFVAGAVDREFDRDDPLGSPRAQATALLPALPVRTTLPQIAWLTGERDLRNLSLLEELPRLNEAAALALIKSARMFQKSLWVADTSPEIAWLLLISAIETAAAFWAGDLVPPEERLRLSLPKLADILEENCSPEFIEKVADSLAPLIGATNKFVSFCLAFPAGPPKARPAFGQFDFDPTHYKRAMAKIYGYRSRALHGGTPFPYPMCDPPRQYHPDEPKEEKPSGLAASALGGTWVADDLPMYLHLFAHITRESLLAWWRHLARVTAEAV